MPQKQRIFLFLAFALVLCGSPLFAVPLESIAFTPTDARNRLLSAAAKYEHTPYRYGGIDRNGLDCSGLLYVSFRDALGVSVPRSTTGLYSWVEKIPDEKLQPGDLLFFKTDNSGKISHAGIYAGNGRFIHSASEGPLTGVLYSMLSERYWARTYAGAGRALPETGEPVLIAAAASTSSGTSSGSDFPAGSAASAGSGSGASIGGIAGRKPSAGSGDSAETGKPRLLLGAGIAPTWQAFLKDGTFIRGFASQFRVGAESYSLGTLMVFCLELRPEYDGGLGVFRLPITLSWGIRDKFSIFLGPSFSFGDAAISTSDGERRYSGGFNWVGAIGITAAPFLFDVGPGEMAPYLEAAWQSYFSENDSRNANADFSAGFRFSTGVRYTFKL